MSQGEQAQAPEPNRARRLCPICSTPLGPDFGRHQACLPALEDLVVERDALAASLDQLLLRLAQLERERDDCRRVDDSAGADRAGAAYDLLIKFARAESRALTKLGLSGGSPPR
jgi:hypothetical protein